MDSTWNATAIQLGRIQVEFEALYGSKSATENSSLLNVLNT